MAPANGVSDEVSEGPFRTWLTHYGAMGERVRGALLE